jgi:hypothetical protein
MVGNFLKHSFTDQCQSMRLSVGAKHFSPLRFEKEGFDDQLPKNKKDVN